MNSLVKKIIFKNINYAFAYYRYSDNSITFSLRSACCSLDAFDYLIIHELSHYFYHNIEKKLNIKQLKQYEEKHGLTPAKDNEYVASILKKEKNNNFDYHVFHK